MGYWTNVLSRMTKRFSLTQSQKRLMVKELESHECFDDLYGTTGSAQKEIFVKVVKKYYSLYESCFREEFVMIIDSHMHFGKIMNFHLRKNDVVKSMNKYNIDKFEL